MRHLRAPAAARFARVATLDGWGLRMSFSYKCEVG